MIKISDIKMKIKTHLGELWWYSIVLFFSQRLGDIINIYIGLWLVPKFVPMEQLGALLPLTQLAGFIGLPLAIILTPFIKFISTFSAQGEEGKVKVMLRDVAFILAISSIGIGFLTWRSASFFFERLRVDSRLLIWILIGITITTLVTSVTNGALSGLKKFRLMGITGFGSVLLKLIVLLLLLPINGLLGYFSSQFAANLLMCILFCWGIRKLFSSTVKPVSYYGHWKEMVMYTLPFVLIMGVSTLGVTFQYMIVRQRLPEIESAAFYFCSRFSEIPNMIWGAIGCVFFTIISNAHETQQHTRKILVNVLMVSVVGGGIIALILGLSMPWLFEQVALWSPYRPYAYLVGWLAFTNVFRVGFACFMSYELACRRFSFLWYQVPIAIGEFSFLIAFTGYAFFYSYLPNEWVDWMASLRIARINNIVMVYFVTSLLTFCISLVQLWIEHRKGPSYKEKVPL
jgi:O-antigen/teichoic acid export membrane protein